MTEPFGDKEDDEDVKLKWIGTWFEGMIRADNNLVFLWERATVVKRKLR